MPPSIVRGRGIDANALRWLAAHHDLADVVRRRLTGKGAITRELGASTSRGSSCFDPEVAVLADPGSCVRTLRHCEDFIPPSACLNFHCSGLISRISGCAPTWFGPHDFHGAKY